MKREWLEKEIAEMVRVLEEDYMDRSSERGFRRDLARLRRKLRETERATDKA